MDEPQEQDAHLGTTSSHSWLTRTAPSVTQAPADPAGVLDGADLEAQMDAPSHSWQQASPPADPWPTREDAQPVRMPGAAPEHRGPGVVSHLPTWLVLLCGILTFDAAVAASFALPVAGIVVLLVVTVGAGLWMYHRSGLLVAALSLLLVSLPFTTTVSRFNISPQEGLLYAIWVLGALYSPLGTRRWLLQVFSSLSPFARFSILLFALAVGQSAFRLSHPDLVALANSLRQIVVFPTLLALMIAYAVRTRRCMPTLLQAFAASAFLFALYALSLRLLDVGIGIGAVAGRLGSEASFLAQYSPNNLGLYLAFGLAFVPALMYEALRSRRLWELQLAAYSSVATLTLIALWLTYSRGALLALAAVSAVLLLGGLGWARKSRRVIALGIPGAVALAAVVLAVAGGSVLGRYAQLLDPAALLQDPNVRFRLDLYQRAWSLIQSHPLTGIGFGGFVQSSTVPFSPHDTYLDIVVAAGVFAILGLVVVVADGIVAALSASFRFRSLRSGANAMYMLGIAAALVGFLVQSFSESFTGNPRIFPAAWFFVACADATVMALAQRPAAEPTRRKLPASVSRPRADRLEESVLAASESAWAFDNAPLPNFTPQTDPSLNAVLDPYLDSSEHLAAIWPWRVASPRNVKRYGGSIGTGGPRVTGSSRVTGAPGTTGRPRITGAPAVASVSAAAPDRSRERATSQELLRRAPVSYVWNQAYTLWYFVMNFLLSVAIARQLSQQEYGIYSVLLTLLTTLLFVFAFGLEDASTVLVPRLLSLGGEGAAGRFVRRVLLGRLLVLAAVAAILILVIPTQAPLLAAHGVSLDLAVLQGPDGIVVRAGLMAAYLVGNGVVTLENALFASVLRSRVTLLVGGVSQGLLVGLAATALALGSGIDGLFAVLAAVTWLTAIAYLFPLRRLLVARSGDTRHPDVKVRGLMVSAWLINVTSGALGKQSDILLMGIFAVSYAAIGYYNLAYQLANILGVLLIAGLSGVGPAAMSAALGAGGRERLAGVWRAVIVLQLLLTIPVLVFSLVRADAIVAILYGARYADAVPLLQLFLVATLIGRLVGGGVHQGALYVVGRQRLVLINRWVGLAMNIALDVALIPRYGPYGALAATSFIQVIVGGVEQVLVRRYLPVRYPVAFAARLLGASALATVSLVWWAPQNLVGIAASFIGFVLVLVVALLALGVADTADVQRVLDLSPGLRAAWERMSDRLLGSADFQFVVIEPSLALFGTGRRGWPGTRVADAAADAAADARHSVLSGAGLEYTARAVTETEREREGDTRTGGSHVASRPAPTATAPRRTSPADSPVPEARVPVGAALLRAVRQHRIDWALCGALMLIGGLIRWSQLAGQSLWLDESTSLIFAGSSPAQIVQAVLRYDTHPPLYYIVAHYAVRLQLPPLYAVRVPSLLFGIITIGAMYGLGRLLVGRTAGVMAGALTVLCPIAVWYSRDGRMYALVWCCMVVSYLLLLIVLRSPRWYWVAAYALAVALSLYSDISALLGIVPQVALIAGALAWGWFQRRGDTTPVRASSRLRPWWRAALGYAVGWGLFLPWIAVLPQQLGLIQAIHFGQPTAQQYWSLTTDDLSMTASYAFLKTTVPPIFTQLMLAAFLVGAVVTLWAARTPRWRLYAGVAAALTLGVATVFGGLILAGSRAILVPRVVGIGSFGAILVIAGAVGILVQIPDTWAARAVVGTRQQRRLTSDAAQFATLALAGVLLAVSLGGNGLSLGTVEAQGTNGQHWDAYAHLIDTQAQPDDVVMYDPLGLKTITDPYLLPNSPWRTQAKGLWPQVGQSPEPYFDQTLPRHAHIWFLFYASSSVTMPVYDTWIQHMGYCRQLGDPQIHYGLVKYVACSSSSAPSPP